MSEGVIDIGEQRRPKKLKPGMRGLRAVGVRVNRDGTLSISRWEQTGQPWWRRITHLVVPDLLAAIRQQRHILEETYGIDADLIGGELHDLERFQEAVFDIEERLWNWKKLSDEEKELIKADFRRLEKRFSGFRNEWKVLAGAQFYHAKTLVDCLGRTNPPAMAFRAHGALHKLRQRMEQIGLIASKLSAREQALRFEKGRIERIFYLTARGIRGMLESTALQNRPNFLKQTKGLDRRISALLSEVHTITVNPYKEPRIRIGNALLAAQRAIRQRDILLTVSHLKNALKVLDEI